MDVAEALEPTIPGARARTPKRLLALRGEQHLVERLRAGDEAAFEVLYDRYAAPLLSFCRHMLGRQEEAEDAVQQVFASAHSDLLRNQRELELKPWLYAIARNRCLSVLRARREQPGPHVEPTTEGLHQQVQARADLRQLVADLADLPENQRAALLLTELEDLSHAEAATVLECEATQVKGLVFRAREGLIERRDARSASCEEIRAELSTARRGALRRGRLRHHLAHCPGCSEYLEEVRRQRRMMALILPVIPATGLKRTVLATVGMGTATGGASVVGGSVLTGTVAKVAAVAVLAGGTGVATKEIVDRDRSAPERTAPAAPVSPAAGASPAAARSEPARADRAGAEPGAPAKARRRARDRGRPADVPRGSARSRGQSRSNQGATPPGQLRRQATGQGKSAPAKPSQPPGQAKKVPARSRATPQRGAPSPSPRAGPKTVKPAKPQKPAKP